MRRGHVGFEQDDPFGRLTLRPERLEKILQGVDHQGLVGGKMRRAGVHFGTMGPADGGNLGVVGRNDNAVDLAHLPGDFNRPGEQRFSSQRPDVFPGHRFAAAPCGNDCDDSFSI